MDAFIKKLSDSVTNSINVWDSKNYTDEINERFESCLFHDESLPARGVEAQHEFARELA